MERPRQSQNDYGLWLTDYKKRGNDYGLSNWSGKSRHIEILFNYYYLIS